MSTRRKPHRWFAVIGARDGLADIRTACNAALKRRGLPIRDERTKTPAKGMRG